jgi:hypothetical protein
MLKIPVESNKAQKKIINEINDEVKLHNDIWPDINFLTDNRFDCHVKEDVPSKQDIVCSYYVYGNNVETSTNPNFNGKPTL